MWPAQRVAWIGICWQMQIKEQDTRRHLCSVPQLTFFTAVMLFLVQPCELSEYSLGLWRVFWRVHPSFTSAFTSNQVRQSSLCYNPWLSHHITTGQPHKFAVILTPTLKMLIRCKVRVLIFVVLLLVFSQLSSPKQGSTLHIGQK